METLVLMGVLAIIIPSILISQAVGEIVGTVRHHNYNSANFNSLTKDTKIVLAIVLPGVLACVIGAYIAVSMCIGAVIGAFISLWITFKKKTEKVRKLIGVLQ